jgi:hypothetical protein
MDLWLFGLYCLVVEGGDESGSGIYDVDENIWKEITVATLLSISWFWSHRANVYTVDSGTRNLLSAERMLSLVPIWYLP